MSTDQPSSVDHDADRRHPDFFHFVLGLDHDPLAFDAIYAYADACSEFNPKLSADLFRALRRYLGGKPLPGYPRKLWDVE